MAKTADSFLLRRDRLEILNRQDDACLQRLIAGATAQLDQAGAARGGVMRLTRKSGKADFTAVVSALAQGSGWTEAGPMAFVLITDAAANPALPVTMLRQLYNVTLAEARIAERLMTGDSPEEAAATLDIKISTVRWHLASLYRKTGTKRQAELVRLLLSLPTI